MARFLNENEYLQPKHQLAIVCAHFKSNAAFDLRGFETLRKMAAPPWPSQVFLPLRPW